MEGDVQGEIYVSDSRSTGREGGTRGSEMIENTREGREGMVVERERCLLVGAPRTTGPGTSECNLWQLQCYVYEYCTGLFGSSVCIQKCGT